MTTPSRAAALVTSLLLLSGLSPAFGQEAPRPVTQPTTAPVEAAGRCGGLLCDAYYSMHPNAVPGATSLPCHDFLCGGFGGRTPDQPPPAQQAAAVPEPVTPPKKRHKRAAKPAKAPSAAMR